MTTLTDDPDPDNRDCCEKGAFTDPNVTFVEIRDVVETVDLVDSVKALFFDHGCGASRALFSWLHE